VPRTRNLVILLVLTGALAVGCARPSTAATPVQTAAVDLPPSYRFEPSAIQIARGTTVTWTNHDNFTHSVQVSGQTEVHMLKPGESTQITFTAAGAFAYVCTLHAQNMRGTVTVT
jgi:plastocyanin